MSDKPAREFWLEPYRVRGGPVYVVHEQKIEDRILIHVIDKQAYDSLLDEADKLSDLLSLNLKEWQAINNSDENRFKYLLVWQETYRAITNWQKFRSGI